jgi:hypothetical protein
MIACVLRSGGTYTPAHVQRLAAQARAWAPSEPFVCLTDVAVPGVATLALSRRWPGWWSKMELFAPELFPMGMRILYMDLDTTILGPLEALLARPEPFLVLGDFYRRPPAVAERGIGSGLMMWTAGALAWLYARFAADPEGAMWRAGSFGDQRFIEVQQPAVAFWEDVVPGSVVSYKLHCRPVVPAGARVVAFHGRPKPWDVPALEGEIPCLVS